MRGADAGPSSGSGPRTEWQAARTAVLLVVVCAVPVVFDTRVHPAFARPKVTVLVLGAAMLLFLAGAEWVRLRRWPWRNALAVPALAYLAWTGVASAASGDPVQSLLGGPDSLHGLLTIAALTILGLAAAEVGRREARTLVAALWFVGGGAVLGYGAVQLRDRVVGGPGWDPVPWLNRPGDGAIWSTLGNPNDLAGFLVILLPVGLALLVTGSPGVRTATSVMVTLLLVELVVTASRGAVLGGVAALLALGAWWRPRPTGRPGRVVVATLALGTALGAVVLTAGVGADRSVDELLGTGRGTTAGLRIELWRGAWRLGTQHPLTGVGPDRFGPAFDAVRSDAFVRTYGPELLATDPHNVFLTVLATTGFPGLVVFLVLTASALVPLWKARREGEEDAPLGAAVAAGLVAYLVQAAFNRQDIALDVCFWFLLGLSCGFGTGAGATQADRRGRARATTAAATATSATARATQETVLPPSSASPPAATSLMSLHHSWRSVSAASLIVRRTAQPRAAPGLNVEPA